jgi:hypothetical protein
MHATGEAHDTPESPVVAAACTYDEVCGINRFPSQRAARAGRGAEKSPTIVHPVAVAHETPSTPSSMPVRPLAVWLLHVFPSQRWTETEPLGPLPTAVHAESRTHETAASPADRLVGSIVQLEPSQRSAKAPEPDAAVPLVPTAAHAVAEAQDTALSALSC